MFRTAFATVLVLLGCLLAGPAVAAFILVGEVTDQDSYLEAVTPLADDPAVRTAVADQLSAAFNDKVPEAARQLVDASITNFVESDQFQPAWVKLNTEVHPQLLALLRDEGGRLAVEGDAVVLDLGVVAADVKARFAADGVPLADRIPDIDSKVQVLSGSAVRQAVPAFDLLEKLSVALPIAAIILIALGLTLSARRGQTLIVTGIGLVVVMLLVVLFEWLARSQVTAKSPSPELAGPFYDALTSKVSIVLWVVCGIGGVFVIIGAMLARRASTASSQPAADYRDRGSYRR
ncbi:MAG: hypothetical protein GEV28_39950 [Actinophytocola sp.]|uniref:hypothetical protein n=1 Tax=Actinophytocola sp. TaxID=1872138 RepID=UPI00132C2E22|nr:hypothetical protein [Actinophytocola sp.]MPZ86217.1 hypothetical protein [Actinophytocola sp.]